MRFDLTEYRKLRRELEKANWDWQWWWAWHPIKTGEDVYVWLEWVHRRRLDAGNRDDPCDFVWEYSEIPNSGV